MRVRVPGAQFFFEDQTKSFFLSFGQGIYIFEESPKSIEDVIGDVYCPGKMFSNREQCESLGSYVTTQDPFMVVESVEPDNLLKKFPICYKSA